MHNFEGKTIILGAPKHFHLDHVIESELQSLGFNTVNISFYSDKFVYDSWLQRITCFMARNIVGMKDYKTRLKFDTNKDRMEDELARIALADYALIIRPDVYPIDFIKKLRSKTKKLIAYQWDGLDCYPNVYKCIGLFDRFFVFDGDDLGRQSVMPITNYYLEAISAHMQYNEALQSDVFYTGSYAKERIAVLGRLAQDLRQLGCNFRYHLKHKRKRYLESYDLWTTGQTLSYEENIRYAYNTNIILDLVRPSHQGLSFRFFEAIRFGKKLITNNPKAKAYDFYHPNNIFIWDNNDIAELEAFVHKPYVPIPEEVKEKYSFQNWIRYALDEGEYTRLSIPQ